MAAAGSDGRIRGWNLSEDQDPSWSIDGHVGPVNSIAFSPSAPLLASGGADGTVRFFQLSGLSLDAILPGEANYGLSTFTTSPSGDMIVGVEPIGTTRAWNPRTGRTSRVPLPQFDGTALDKLAFSPDGQVLAAATGLDSLVLWDMSTGDQVDEVPYLGWVHSLDFTPDSNLVAAATAGEIHLWNVDERKWLWDAITVGPEDRVVADVDFSPDGSVVATTTGDDIRFWDVQTGEQVGTTVGDRAIADFGENYISDIEFSNDGSYLAIGGTDGSVRFVDPETGQLASLTRSVHASGVWRIAFHPTASIMASSGGNSTQLWDTDTLEPVGEAMDGRSAIFTASGQLLVLTEAAASADPYIRAGSVTAIEPIWSEQEVCDLVEPLVSASSLLPHLPDGWDPLCTYSPEAEELFLSQGTTPPGLSTAP
jgi:WD40 repeat protein